MWWVSGSHLINFWEIWIVGWKEAYVAADIMYILPDAHTYVYLTTINAADFLLIPINATHNIVNICVPEILMPETEFAKQCRHPVAFF